MHSKLQPLQTVVEVNTPWQPWQIWKLDTKKEQEALKGLGKNGKKKRTLFKISNNSDLFGLDEMILI